MHPSGDMLSPLALGWMLQPSGLLHLKFKQEHLCTSPEIFSEENLRTYVGIEPTPPHLRCDALPVELPSPAGSKVVGSAKGDSMSPLGCTSENLVP